MGARQREPAPHAGIRSWIAADEARTNKYDVRRYGSVDRMEGYISHDKNRRIGELIIHRKTFLQTADLRIHPSQGIIRLHRARTCSVEQRQRLIEPDQPEPCIALGCDKLTCDLDDCAVLLLRVRPTRRIPLLVLSANYFSFGQGQRLQFLPDDRTRASSNLREPITRDGHIAFRQDALDPRPGSRRPA